MAPSEHGPAKDTIAPTIVPVGGQSRDPGSTAPTPESRILELQGTAGNHAVAGLIASSTGTHRAGVQRAPNPSDATAKAADAAANALIPLIKSQIAKAGFGTVPAATADLLIGLVEAFLQRYGEANAFLLVTPLSNELYDLLAPWGYKGGGVSEGRLGQVKDDLDAAIAKWRARSQRERTKSRDETPKTMGRFTAKPSVRDMEIEDRQVHTEPMREGDAYTGPKSAIRAEKERRKNVRLMEGVNATRSAGPIATLGMAVGAGTAAATGGDTEFGRDSGLAIGGLGDPFFQTFSDGAKAAADRRDSSGNAGSGGDPSANVEPFTRKPMPAPDHPTTGGASSAGGAAGQTAGPAQTLPGMGALGPRGAASAPEIPKTEPGYAPGPGAEPHPASGPATQPGYAAGPGAESRGGQGAAGARDSVLAGTPAPTSAGKPGARFWSRLAVPDYPSPAPKASNVNPATPQEVQAIFQQRPDRVILGSSSSFHQFRWELQRWKEGRPTAEPAPIAFHAEDGYVHVDAERWREQVGDPSQLIRP